MNTRFLCTCNGSIGNVLSPQFLLACRQDEVIPRTSESQRQERPKRRSCSQRAGQGFEIDFSPFIKGCVVRLPSSNMNVCNDFHENSDDEVLGHYSQIYDDTTVCRQKGCQKFRRAHFEEVPGVWYIAPRAVSALMRTLRAAFKSCRRRLGDGRQRGNSYEFPARTMITCLSRSVFQRMFSTSVSGRFHSIDYNECSNFSTRTNEHPQCFVWCWCTKHLSVEVAADKCRVGATVLRQTHPPP